MLEDRLVPVNALVGLVTRNDVNPPALADAGFRLVGLEIPVVAVDGRVTVDALLLHEASGHLLLCEVKSGANVEESQARRYASIDARAVIQAGHITLPHRVHPTTEAIYVCLAKHLDRIQHGLRQADVQVPVLAVGRDTVALQDFGTASDQLRQAFRRGPVSLSGPPLRLVTFDHDSLVDNVEPTVMAEVVALLARRVPQITARALAERAAPYFGLYGRAARNRLVTVVEHAMRRIADREPLSFAYDPPTANREGILHLLRSPEEHDPRGRTQAYQALARASHTRRRRPAADPNQLDLLAELDKAVDDSAEGDNQGEEDVP